MVCSSCWVCRVARFTTLSCRSALSFKEATFFGENPRSSSTSPRVMCSGSCALPLFRLSIFTLPLPLFCDSLPHVLKPQARGVDISLRSLGGLLSQTMKNVNYAVDLFVQHPVPKIVVLISEFEYAGKGGGH